MSEMKFIAEPGKQEVIVTLVFDAPRDLLFKTYLDPDLRAEWWGPSFVTTKVEKIEARTGGSWRIVQRDPEGNEFAFHGVFHEVTPERIVETFEWEGMPGHVSFQTSTLEETGGKTTLTLNVVFQSVEDRDGMVNSGMREGMDEGMKRLDVLLQRILRGTAKAA
ncbi:MAG: SRPBCC family protein [Dehalococcoidia bacterium]|jgi:uncharacterized protein YndB with AHSA1/START domain